MLFEIKETINQKDLSLLTNSYIELLKPQYNNTTKYIGKYQRNYESGVISKAFKNMYAR